MKLQKPKITCIERTHCRKTKTVEDFGIVGLESMFALLQIIWDAKRTNNTYFPLKLNYLALKLNQLPLKENNLQ